MICFVSIGPRINDNFSLVHIKNMLNIKQTIIKLSIILINLILNSDLKMKILILLQIYLAHLKNNIHKM